MAELTPIPLTRLLPTRRPGEAPQAKPSRRTASGGEAQPPKVLDVTSTVVEPSVPDSEHLREEYEILSLKLRLHHNKSQELVPAIYATTLQRALDIVTLLNQTTAGPKAKNKKIGVEKQSPKSLADL